MVSVGEPICSKGGQALDVEVASKLSSVIELMSEGCKGRVRL